MPSKQMQHSVVAFILCVSILVCLLAFLGGLSDGDSILGEAKEIICGIMRPIAKLFIEGIISWGRA